MVEIENYISELIEDLKTRFGKRLKYVGLQGSYLRGEATEHSDIDIMVVMDELDVSDLVAYRSVIKAMDHYEKSCGFICGTEDLAKWNPMEICHVYNTTKDYYGCLVDMIPEYTRQDICNFVKMSINNLYHEICHRYIHADPETNVACLPQTYKGVFFILQNLHYLDTGCFVATKAELLDKLSGRNREVLQRALDLNSGMTCDFESSFDLLFTWCKETMMNM